MRVGFISRATAVVAFSVFLSSTTGFADEPAGPRSAASPEPIFGIQAAEYDTAAGDFDTDGPRLPVRTTASLWNFRQTLVRSGQGGGADIEEASMQITQVSYNNAPCNEDDPKVETPNTLEILWTETVAHVEAEVSVDGELVGAVPGLTQEQLDAGITINGVLLDLDSGVHTINVSELDTGTFVEKDFDVLETVPGFPAIHHLICLQGEATPDVGEGCVDSCEIRISMTANAGADFYNLILDDVVQAFDIPFGIPVVTLVCAPSGDYTLQVRPHLAARDEDGAIVPGCSYAGCPQDGEGCTLDCADEELCIAPMNMDVAQDGYAADGAAPSFFALWINGEAPGLDGDGVPVTPPYPGGVNVYFNENVDPDFTPMTGPDGFPPFFGVQGLAAGETLLFFEGVCADDVPSAIVERSVTIVEENPHADAVTDGRIVQIFDEGGPDAGDETMQLIWENDAPSANFITLLRRDAQTFIIAAGAGLNFKFPGDIEGITFTGPILPNDIFALEFYAYDDDAETDAMYSSTAIDATEPTDTDEDGFFDHEDNCPDDANDSQEDFDEDGVGDVCDNCEFDPNPDQSDADEDGVGDACDEGDDGPLFIRGICANLGVSLQLSQAVYIFAFLFTGGETPTCPEACDSDLSGALDLTDGIVILQFLFLGGSPPANWDGVTPVCEFGDPKTCQANPDCTAPGPV